MTLTELSEIRKNYILKHFPYKMILATNVYGCARFDANFSLIPHQPYCIIGFTKEEEAFPC